MQLDAFCQQVAPEVMGCPDPLVRSAVVSAADVFCRDTLCWTEFSDPEVLEEGVQDYELQPPTGAYLVTVLDVWVNNRRLTPMTMQALAEAMPNWMGQRGAEPLYYNQAAARGSLRFFPTPAGLATPAPQYVVRGVFAPRAGTAVLPDFLGSHFMEAVSAGAKARLMAMPGVAWSSPQMAAYYTGLVAQWRERALGDEAMDRVPGARTVAARTFGF